MIEVGWEGQSVASWRWGRRLGVGVSGVPVKVCGAWNREESRRAERCRGRAGMTGWRLDA